MTQPHQPAETSVPAAEAIEDFGDLYPRPTGINSFTVLSLAADGFTAYECNIQTMDCECRDKSFNRDEGEICKHLAAALYQAPDVRDFDREMIRSLGNDLEDIHGRLDDLARKTTVVEAEAKQATETAHGVANSGDSQPVDDRHEPVTVDEVTDWLETGFTRPAMVDIKAGSHGSTDGIILEPDNQNMQDHVYESFKGLVNSLEDSEVHVGFGDDECHTCGESDGEFYYFVPEDDSSEVFQDG